MGKREKKRLHKKAPGAPKRGKSPYILYSMDKREEIKTQLPDDAKVTEVMKAIADAWACLSDDQKQPWKTAADADKQRYEDEMANYDGPLRVPNKRAKKNPDAPKRAMSAFLFYSQIMRPRLKAEHPELKNTEISQRLGHSWAACTNEEKHIYVVRAKEDLARYRHEMEEWHASRQEYETTEV